MLIAATTLRRSGTCDLLPPGGELGVRLICPKCLGRSLTSVGDEDSVNRFMCQTCHHKFGASEGLIAFRQAINFAQALDNPTRRNIILRFATVEELAVGEIAKALAETIPNISYHVKVLCAADPPLLLIGRQKEQSGKLPPITYYRVNRSI